MVPNGWGFKQLDEVCSKPISYGIVQTGENIKNGIPCARVVDLTKNEFDICEMIKTTEEIHQSYKKTILEKGELMMALRGEIGLVRIVPEHLIGINITRGIARLSPKNNVVDSEYLLWIMRSNQVRNDLKRKAGGSALQEISLTALRKVKVAVPSLPEQRKIANILATWDKAISTTERLIDNSKQQKKALMQQLLTCKKRLLDDSGKPFEGEWEEVIFGDCIEHTGGTALEKHVIDDAQHHFISIGNYSMDGKYIDKGQRIELNSKTKTKLLNKNDLVMVLNDKTKTGDIIGSTILIDEDNKYIYNQRSEKIVPNKEINVSFFWYLLNSFQIRTEVFSRSQGGTQIYVNFGALKSMALNLPKQEEQKKIATVLTNAYKEIELLEQQLADLKQEKKALMQQLLTGKRRVKIEEMEVA